MILMVVGAVIGLGIGWFSYVHQKAFFATLATLSAFGAVVYAKVVVPFIMGAVMRGIDLKGAFSLVWGKVPMGYREAVALALICVLVGRMATYFSIKTRQNLDDMDPDKAHARKRAKLKAQARKQYGLKDTVDSYRQDKEAAAAAADVMGNMRAMYSKAA